MAAAGQATANTPLVATPADKDAAHAIVPSYDAASDEKSVAKARKDAFDVHESKGSHCFPFSLILTMPLYAIAPKTWRWIVSFPHFILVMGILANFFIMIETIVSWHQYGCRMKGCPSRVIPLLFVAVCTSYFIVTVEQYDDTLVDKQEEIKRKKEECSKNYQATVSELDSCLSKAMNTQAFLSERTFESKRRAFFRFLQRIGPQLTSSDDPKLMEEFRSFLLHWLSVFSECSIDPSDKPLTVLSPDKDLADCRTASEMASIAADRLKLVEVDFIQDHVEMDKKSLASALETVAQITSGKIVAADEEQGRLEFEGAGLEEVGQVEEKLRWVQWGLNCPGMSCGEQGCWPFTIYFGFVSIVILSQEHFNLLVAFIIGCFDIWFEVYVFHVDAKWGLIAELVTSLVCLAFVLYDFVDIDIIQQLEAQLFELNQAHEDVQKKTNKATDFYDKTRELTDLWLHRTLPRLLLLQQFHDELLHMQGTDRKLVPMLTEINTQFAALEKSLPVLALWENEETIKAKKKKVLGNTLMRLVNSDVATALKLMPETAQAFEAETLRLTDRARARTASPRSRSVPVKEKTPGPGQPRSRSRPPSTQTGNRDLQTKQQ